jgi:hypothetical protein
MAVLNGLRVTIEGIGPLLMHNGDLANPRNPIVQAMKQITQKRGKTESDHELMSQIEWVGGLYTIGRFKGDDIVIDSQSGTVQVNANPVICIPRRMIEAMLHGGAKKSKLGKQVQAGVFVEKDFPLEFPGHGKTIQELLNDPSYLDLRGVKVGTARVMRSRPVFDNWSLTFELSYQKDVVNRSNLEDSICSAGQLLGIGDYRPSHGRFRMTECVDI